MFQSVVKMFVLSAFCFESLLIIFIEGSPSKERMVQLRREKRDVDILVSCDDQCLPEDQITDYDILLQYDDDPESSQDPSLSDFKRKPCAFPCKIVHMNKTKEASGILGGEFTIMSVEEVPDKSYELETSSISNFHTLTTMVGQQKNVSFSSSINENATIKYEPLETTSTCDCMNSANTTPSPKEIDQNNTENTSRNHTSTSTFVTDIGDKSNVNSDFEEPSMKVVNETTTHKQLISYSVVPVVPKVIRFTALEAEMAEAGLTSAGKTRDKVYYDVNSNASLVLKGLIDKLVQHGVPEPLVQGNSTNEHEDPLSTQKLSSSTLSQIVETVTVSQTSTSLEPSKIWLTKETSNSDHTTKKSLIKDEFQLVSPVFNIPPEGFLQDNVSLPIQNSTSYKPEVSSQLEIQTLEPPKESLNNYSETTNISLSKSTIDSAHSDVITSTPIDVVTPTENTIETTEVKLKNVNLSSLNNESIFSERVGTSNQTVNKSNFTNSNNSFEKSEMESSGPNSMNTSLVNTESPFTKENNPSETDYTSSKSNVTSLVDANKLHGDVHNVTENPNVDKHPVGSEESSSTVTSESGERDKNVTALKMTDSKDSILPNVDLLKIPVPRLINHNISLGLQSESLGSLNMPNITLNTNDQQTNSSNQSSMLQVVVPSTNSSNVTKLFTYNNITAPSNSSRSA